MQSGLLRSLRRWDVVAVCLNGVIGAGIFGKTDEDSMEDFKSVYDFEDAFVKPFAPEKSTARPSSPPPGLPAPKSL